jgi:hypothetical protein
MATYEKQIKIEVQKVQKNNQTQASFTPKKKNNGNQVIYSDGFK